MNLSHIRLITALAVCASLGAPTFAAGPPAPVPARPIALASTAPAMPAGMQLRIATGKAGKGFSRVFADIRGVCGSVVPLVEVETEGGLQNLTVLAANKADLGFVQVDTLNAMRDGDTSIGALQALMPMNTNLLHVVARASGFERPPNGLIDRLSGSKTVVVASIGDLKHLPVAVVGSARALGRELDRTHALGLQFVDVSTDEEGLGLLKRGTVAALFSTSGWPNGPVQALKRSDRLYLVRFDLKVQQPYQIVTRNYENLDAFKLPFLGVQNLLMTRPFTPDGAYGRAVAALRDCMKKNLVTLREGPYEPSWQEVKVDAPAIEGVTVFGAVAR
jgi:TRAP-type uncharacterized transport system substrate-binding protein